jgi:hypothetical protein
MFIPIWVFYLLGALILFLLIRYGKVIWFCIAYALNGFRF